VSELRRVSVVGGSATGKTTFSRDLALRLGVPHIELDALHHGPDWEEASADVLHDRVEEALTAAPEGWVADGNYHGKLGTMVLERADTVVFLDLPLRTALRRVSWRTLRRILRREELWNGNRESLRTAFSRESIVWWVVTQHRTHRAKWPERFAALPHLRVVRLRSPREVEEFLQSIQPTASMSGSSNGSERQKTPPSVET
jgi:adenylate kinase family enzyme